MERRLVISASQKPEEEKGQDSPPPSVCLGFPPRRKMTTQFLVLRPIMTASRGGGARSPPMGLSQAYPEDSSLDPLHPQALGADQSLAEGLRGPL